mmetsp:Transcript_27125/g.41286  ORF Transcript_27125/g.41286 Transcript_27125/m.41286 type:complete len:107 (+) Transcript_27125:1030-1350(+)
MLSNAIVYFNYFYCGFASLLFIVGSVLILVPKYLATEGEFFMGACNELFSAVFLLLIFTVYHQAEITEEQVVEKNKIYEEEYERQKSEASSRYQMSMRTHNSDAKR